MAERRLDHLRPQEPLEAVQGAGDLGLKFLGVAIGKLPGFSRRRAVASVILALIARRMSWRDKRCITSAMVELLWYKVERMTAAQRAKSGV